MPDEPRNDSDEQNEEQRPKFKLVDKRRINVDEIEAADEPVEEKPVADKKIEPVVETPADPEGEGAEIPEETKEPPGRETPSDEPEDVKSEPDPLDFRNIAISILQTIATVILVDLGLVPHPQTNLVAKKLEEARKSIELFDLVFGNVRDELPEQIVKEFERAIMDLKANYVNQL